MERYLKKAIQKADTKGKWIVSVRKLQFFKPTSYWQKGVVPVAINVKANDRVSVQTYLVPTFAKIACFTLGDAECELLE